MNLFIRTLKATATALLLAVASFAAAADRPVIRTQVMHGLATQAMSDNGLWALAWGAEDEQLPPVLIDIRTNGRIALQTEADIQENGLCFAYDVTDDGRIIAGQHGGQPAWLDRDTGRWTCLPCSSETGTLRAITPDGRFAVGSVCVGDVRTTAYTNEKPALWNLATGQDITPTDLPAVDPDGMPTAEGYMRFTAISPDGRFIVGQTLASSYCTFVYDREQADGRKWRFLGFSTADGSTFTKDVADLLEIYPQHLSPSGEWLACDARVSKRGDEFLCSARYNLLTGRMDIYSDTMGDEDKKSGCIDNRGTLYSASPSGSPLRELFVRHDGYWYPLRTLLTQAYGLNFLTATGFDNTGTPMGVSADGLTFAGFSDPQYGENYTIRMSEPLTALCQGINLLGSYIVAPAPGSTFARVGEVRVSFDREIEVIGAQTAATFGEWSSVGGNGIMVDPTDPRTVIVTFRPRPLTEGQDYLFTLPAGTICIKGDRTRTNADITAQYTGRGNRPVEVLQAYPADGSQLSKLDNASLPVTLTFDTQVQATASASAALYGSDGSRLAPLAVAVAGTTVQLCPATTQYLFLGEEYTVVLEAGSVADLGGSSPNERFTLRYTGSYEREVSADNGTLFSDDFNNISRSLATWLLYENDHNQPAEEMEAMEFTADSTPWNFSIRDNMESADFCAASHSIYDPAGRSDDWMMTPQIYIPDDRAALTFDAQSLRKANNDRLKVVVWAADEVCNFLTPEAFERLCAEGVTVFDERLAPGDDEETLADDWTSYTVPLSDYAGQSVYIAFVNQNDNQSMVFVDNVKVMREMPYLLTLSNKQSVVNETSIAIAGSFTLSSADGTPYRLTLLDAEGSTVDTIEATAETAEAMPFAFVRPLPLETGEVNRFAIRVEFEDAEGWTSDEVKSSVKSLTFNPVKRVVLEEMTGTTCGNCPMGIIAIDRMKELYGEQIIPISIHTYDGDPWGAGLYGYSAALGLNAAPTAVVNRATDVVAPMMTDPMTFSLTLSYYGALWLDCVAAELDEPTYIEVEATVQADETAGTFTLPLTLRSALNATNMNLNVFIVFMEDRLTSIQHNYFSSKKDPLLGEWGLGGRYGQPTATGITHNDVVRQVYGATYNGTPGLLPQSLRAGQDFETEISGQLPSNVEVLDNTKFAVLLIDANTDRVVNACVALTNPSAGISLPSASSSAAPAYNLAGQRVGPGYRGITVRNGRKTLQRQ